MANGDKEVLGEDSAERLASGLVSKSGQVLGGLITLPEPLAVVASALQPMLVGKLSEIGEEPVRKGVTALARATGATAAKAEAAGQMAGKVAAIALPYTLNIGNVVSTARIHVQKRKELLASISPLLAANKEAHKSEGALGAISSVFDNGHSDNKMVATALQAIKKETYANLSMDAASLAPSLVNNYRTHLLNQYKELAVPKNRKRNSAALEDMKKQLSNCDTMYVPASGLLATETGKYLERKAKSRIADTSLDKVEKLQDFIRDNALDGMNNVASGSAMGAVAEMVESVFQTYQKEQGHKLIPSHRMKEVSQMIASELIEGDMHALSLINIVGYDKLLTDKKDGLVSSDKIASVLKQEIARFSKSSTITSEDFFKDMDSYTLDDLKARLQSKDKDERALAVILHPESVLLEAGMKKEEIKANREHLSNRMLEGVYSEVLNGLNQKSPEQLAALGLDRRDIKYLDEHEGQPIAIELKNKANEAQVKKIVAKALMGEESTAWRDAITAGKASALKSKGPAANDESHAAAVRKSRAANDATYTLTSDGSPAR